MKKNNFIYFRGPSKERILKNLEGKTTRQKIKVALNNDVYWLIEECCKNEKYKLSSYAFTVAAFNGCLNILKELLKNKNLDPSYSDNSALRISIYNYDYLMAKILLKDERVYNNLSEKEKIKYKSILNE
jgi:hypothetical protein